MEPLNLIECYLCGSVVIPLSSDKDSFHIPSIGEASPSASTRKTSHVNIVGLWGIALEGGDLGQEVVDGGFCGFLIA
jgi:hypothetical protein